MQKTIENTIFEEIKHVDEYGNEYWYARELMKTLEYGKWDNFNKVIKQAILTCKNSCVDIYEQFPEVGKLSINVNGGKRLISDYKLTRYACYLIAQNADPRKEVVALAKIYFAIQTRKQELFEENYKFLSEDKKRIYNRELVRKKNFSLNQTAQKSGVKDFAKFHNSEYMGLYNGMTANDIYKMKNLNYRQDILDFMSSGELIDNLLG